MITLGYWNFRGSVQPIRYLLAYLGIEYTQKTYTEDQEWFGKDKTNIDIEFANLPYYVDQDIKVTQTNAIPVYLIKKNKRHDLLGQNEDGSFSMREVKVTQAVGAVKDLIMKMIPLCYRPDFQQIKNEEYEKNIQPQLKKILTFLGDKEFLVEKVSYADFVFYECVCYLAHLYPQSMNVTLKSYKSRFENLQGIKQYLKNPNVDLNCFLSKNHATWSGPEQN